jgi:hypothetical protein
MRPEPSHRPAPKRKRWPNEARPLSIRVGAIRDELDARSDGTESGYRAVIARDLMRYWGMLPHLVRLHRPLDEGRSLFEAWQAGELEHHMRGSHESMVIAMTDLLERASILVTHAGLTVDAALVVVGLVKEEE